MPSALKPGAVLRDHCPGSFRETAPRAAKDLIVAATPEGDEVMRVCAPKEFEQASRKLRRQCHMMAVGPDFDRASGERELPGRTLGFERRKPDTTTLTFTFAALIPVLQRRREILASVRVRLFRVLGPPRRPVFTHRHLMFTAVEVITQGLERPRQARGEVSGVDTVRAFGSRWDRLAFTARSIVFYANLAPPACDSNAAR